MKFEIKDKKFYLDSEEFHIYSGAMHYFRIPREYWRDRLLKLKAAGLNTVETYMPWNLHEPKKGVYDFNGNLDIEEYIKFATELGLLVIVRPGPFICAEWDAGGFPAWLLEIPDIHLRCFDTKYLSAVEAYYNVILPKLAKFSLSNDGNLIAVQVENEYGSFARDRRYMKWLRDLTRKHLPDTLLFTSDGEGRQSLSGGGLQDEFMTVNFGHIPGNAFDDLSEMQPDKPLMCAEHWCGWFEAWGSNHPHEGSEKIGKVLDEFFEKDASFNLYMFHGGTNFGFTAGANYYDCYTPTATTYDYDAPLNEYGGYTEKYFVLRDKMRSQLGKTLPDMPAAPVLQNIGKVDLTEYATLFDNISKIGTKHHSDIPFYMERFGQSFGAILYHTEIDGNYPDTKLEAVGVHDIAYVWVNGNYVGKYDRTKLKGKALIEESFSFPIPAFNGSISVDILVEGMGRINFGHKLGDKKGLQDVMIAGQKVYDWTITTLPIDNTEKLAFAHDKPNEFPAFYRGYFNAESNADCFVDVKGFTKGVVYVNGINLGRFWNKGPQRTLYLPGVYLKTDSPNEIIVLELEKTRARSVNIVDKPIWIK